MKYRQYIYYTLLFIFIVAAYWQVSFMRHPLKWDAIETRYPWSYFASECLRSGRLPLWNPYSHCGYPFFADPLSGILYPLTLFIFLIAKYTIYTLSTEFILVIFIGGVGMYHLIRTFSMETEQAFFGALCFAACGFFVSNAEHINWLTAAAWMTWLLWACHRMLQTSKYGYALLGAVFLFLFLSGGYIAFFIVACYILAAILLAGIISEKNKASRVLLTKNYILFTISFLLLAGCCFYSYIEVAHLITRGNGLSLQKANSLPFSPQCTLSFLLPFASIKNDGFFLTDISMRNAYFGIIGLVLMITGLSLPKSKPLWAVTIISLLFLLISFGPYLPLRGWLYHYVPLMNMFRFPALFRIFFIIGFIIIASWAFQQITAVPAKSIPRLRVVIIFLLFALVVIASLELRKYSLAGNYRPFFHNLSQFIEQSLFYQHVLIQCAIQISILLAFLFIIQFRKAKYLTARNILLLCVLDLLIATQLNMYGTVVSTLTCREIDNKTKNLPKNFPVPDNHRPVMMSNENKYQEEMKPLQSNLSFFKKDIAVDGYNPFMLSNFNTLNDSPLKDSVWANPYLYYSYDAVPLTGHSLPDRTASAVTPNIYDRLKSVPLQPGTNDKIEVTLFEPGKIAANIYNEHAAILILQQNSYPGWKVLVDNKETPYFETAYSNMSLVVQPGHHKVIFRFEPQYVRFLFMLSLGTFIAIICYLLVFRARLF